MARLVRALVAYYSRTGNTRRVAEALAEELRSLGYEVGLRRLDELEGVQGVDLLCVGFPVYAWAPAGPALRGLRRLAERRLEGLRVFVFCTYTLAGAGRALRIACDLLRKAGASVIGTVAVLGRFGPLRRGRPSEDDLRLAREALRRALST